jgi:hypothetical protein
MSRQTTILFLALAAIFIFGTAAMVKNTGLPSEMMYIKVHMIEPKVIPGTYGDEPKEIWRAGDKYFRMAEGPDFELHLQQLLIGNERDLWAINLFTKEATHTVDPGAPTSHVPIFSADPKDPLSRLEFGYEKKFFSDPKTVVSKGPELNGRATTKQELVSDGKRLVLITDSKSEKPLRIALMDPSSPYALEYEYLQYETMPFDAKMFAVPQGLKVTEAKAVEDKEKNDKLEKEAISKEIMGFYKSGKPDQLLLLFKRMQTADLFEDPEIGQASRAFITAAVAANPALVSQWCQSVSKFDLVQRLWFWNLVWLTGSQANSDSLKQIAVQTGGEDKQFIDEMLKRAHRDLMREALSPTVLDELWFSYFASGDSKYVKKIMEALPAMDDASQASTADKLTGYAARWSLSANCNQDPNVFSICQKEKAANPRLAKYLKVVLSTDKQEKR